MTATSTNEYQMSQARVARTIAVAPQISEQHGHRSTSSSKEWRTAWCKRELCRDGEREKRSWSESKDSRGTWGSVLGSAALPTRGASLEHLQSTYKV